MPEKTFAVEFTEKEADLLISLLDAAVKSGGLSVANNALVFVNRLQKAFQAKSVLPTDVEILKIPAT